MITRFITRTGFSILWPHSELPFIEQPLGGELLMKRSVAEKLMKDDRVMNQSDWRIDTLYTFAFVQNGDFQQFQRTG
jgi:mannosylglycerate synthase